MNSIQTNAQVEDSEMLEATTEKGSPSSIDNDNSKMKNTMKGNGVPYKMAAETGQGSSSNSQNRKFKTSSARRSRSRSRTTSRGRSSRTSSVRSRSCNNSTGTCTSSKGDPILAAGFLALMSPCICCICYKNWRAKTYTYCRFLH